MSSKRYRAPVDPLAVGTNTPGTTPVLEDFTRRLRGPLQTTVADGPVLKQSVAKAIADAAIAKASATGAIESAELQS